MKLSHKSRIVSALLALVSMMFMQLAVAGYMCPSMQIAHAMDAIAMQVVAIDHHDMSACEEFEIDQPSQCPTQVKIDHQSLDKQDTPRIPPFMALTLVVAINHADVAYHPLAMQREASWLTRTTAPPLSIQNCCFRI